MDLMSMLAAGNAMFGGGAQASGTVMQPTAATPQAPPSLGATPQIQANPQFAAASTVPITPPITAPQFGIVTPSTRMAPSLGTPTLSAPNPTGAPAANSILGMNPNTFASLSGMLAGALTPKDSWQSRVGQVATQAAQTNTLAGAQLKRDQDHQKFLSEALKYYHPSVVQGLSDLTAGHTGYFNPANGVGTPYAPAPVVAGGK